jgi:hypothetical protein
MRDPLPSDDLPLPEASPAATTRRAVAWGALGLVLAGAALSRFGNGASSAGDVHGVVQLVSLSEAEAEAALGDLDLGPAGRTAMLAAIRERRMHLVRAPFFGIGAGVGATVTIACGAVVRSVVLGAKPTPLVLPIERMGRIVLTSGSAPDAEDAWIGLVTAVAPVRLPPLPAGRSLILDVIVQ